LFAAALASSHSDYDFLASRDVDLEGLERVEGNTYLWSGVYSDYMNDPHAVLPT
jgi:hypothetical protein